MAFKACKIWRKSLALPRIGSKKDESPAQLIDARIEELDD
jgi:hypothetical protein